MNAGWTLLIRWQTSSSITRTMEEHPCDSRADCEDELKRSGKMLSSFGYDVLSAFARDPQGRSEKLDPWALLGEPN